MKMRRLTAVLLACAVLFTCVFGLSGCGLLFFDFHTSGDFMYTINKGQYAIIRKFSEQGKEKEVIVVPKEIDGYKVVQYGDNLRGAMPPQFTFMESDKLKSIYFLDSNINFDSKHTFEKCFSIEKIFFIDTIDDIETFEWRWTYLRISMNINSHYNIKIFVNPVIYDWMVEIGKDMTYTNMPDVTYYYNYENAPNDGYYWLDNYDYGEKIQYPPEDPTREGYVFGGWYTESDCVNKWDFETCTLPEGIFDDDGKEVFQETKLFAKWVKGE